MLEYLSQVQSQLPGGRYVDIRIDRQKAARYGVSVEELQQRVTREVILPQGVSLAWSGQFEYLERATAKLKIVLPVTLIIIFVLLWLTFKRISDVLIIMGTLPFSLIGGVWLLWLLEYNLSVAGAVGFIALAGVSAEFGVIMVLYLNQALDKYRTRDGDSENSVLIKAIHEGAVLRVRPKVMTVATIMAGLLPVMWGGGSGAEVMQRIAAPMIGGMVSAPLLSMLVIPALYKLLHQR